MFGILVAATILVCVNTSPVIQDENVGEYGNHFEGDMILTPDQQIAVYKDDISRNGIRDVTKHWPNKTVVYEIHEADFNKTELQMIHDAMAEISNKSCILFRPRNGDGHAVTIEDKANACFSNVGFTLPDYVGFVGGGGGYKTEQVLNLHKGYCFGKIGTVIHQMLHTLGFFHMQSTYDRDKYVKIISENIIPGFENNFRKYSNSSVSEFGVEYDYNSVVHGAANAFAKKGKKTIIPLQKNVIIGQREGLSEGDIVKLNKMYNCTNIIN